MSVQLLVTYPPPKDPAEFDRAYREGDGEAAAGGIAGYGRR